MTDSKLLDLTIAMAHRFVSPLPSAPPSMGEQLQCAACGLWNHHPVHADKNVLRQRKTPSLVEIAVDHSKEMLAHAQRGRKP